MDSLKLGFEPPAIEKKESPKPEQNGSAKDIKSVRWYIDCGDDDFLYEGNSLVHIAMKKKEIPHEYRIRDGVHSWTYWRQALPEVLKFISSPFLK